MSRIAYSLLIPTRNRTGPASTLIRHLLSFFPDNFEVVVQDCGTADELPAALGDLMSDPRLRYAHTGRPVSMTENWNHGIVRCRGEYVTIQGDDDAVSHELPQVISWMRREGIDVLVPSSKHSHYYWPDYPATDRAGTYQMYEYTGELVGYRSEELLGEQIRVFGYADVRTMTYVYGGIVRRVYLERLAARGGGEVFQGYTPDVYSGYLLATMVPMTHWIDYPVFSPGACARSNAAATFTGKSVEVHTRDFRDVDWPAIVPQGSIVQVLIAEGVARALMAAGRTDLLERMNWPDLYTLCMLHDPAFRSVNLRRYWSESGRVLGWTPAKRARELLFGLARRVRGKLTKRSGYLDPRFALTPRIPLERFSGVRDTTELVARQTALLERKGILPPWRQQAGGAAVQAAPRPLQTAGLA